MISKILEILGIVWSAVVLIAAASFFFGEEWAVWKEIKEAHKQDKVVNTAHVDVNKYLTKDEAKAFLTGTVLAQYLKNGDKVFLKSFEGYLLSHNAKGRDELDVIIGGKSTPWRMERE